FFPRPSTPESRRSTARALTAAFRIGPPVTLVLHEVIYGWLDDGDDAAPQLKKMFRAAAAIDVHVAEHRDVLVEKAGVRAERITLVDHGADFVARTTVDQATARRSLGLPADGYLFLSIGFVAPHKGFDRAIRAFAGLGDQGAELHVVGSVRVDDPIANDHRRQLERLAAETPGVHLHLGFVGDEAFDRWIVAADTVVLPYRHIWSSGVAERAALYGRPVIATRVGGLTDQLHGRPAALVDGDDALRTSMRAAAGVGPDSAAPGAGPAAWAFGGPVSRDAVLAEVQRRAAEARGGPVVAPSPARRKGSRAMRPLTRLDEPMPPSPVSARPGVSPAKRLIRRVIGWEIDPLRDHERRLQRAVTEAVSRLAADDEPEAP
ncbi:MAG TPA: glycosyltransferase family 4 protein, partial [Acidimicrobiales bacterium]